MFFFVFFLISNLIFCNISLFVWALKSLMSWLWHQYCTVSPLAIGFLGAFYSDVCGPFEAFCEVTDGEVAFCAHHFFFP